MSNPVFHAWLEERERELLAALQPVQNDTENSAVQKEALRKELQEVQTLLGGTERKHEDTEPPF